MKAEIIKHLFANLPSGAYDADEINLKANAVFAHIYTSGFAAVPGPTIDGRKSLNAPQSAIAGRAHSFAFAFTSSHLVRPSLAPKAPRQAQLHA